jgi:Na+/H+-dicarboxylate symporter
MTHPHTNTLKSSWKLWLPLPNRFGPQRPDILKVLNITEVEFKFIKFVHMIVSVVPLLALANYLKNRQLHTPLLPFIAISSCLLILSYFFGAYILGLVWARIDAKRPRYY